MEVRFREGAGFIPETAHDAVMKRVDERGDVVGLSILGVSRFRKERPFEVELTVGEKHASSRWPWPRTEQNACRRPAQPGLHSTLRELPKT